MDKWKVNLLLFLVFLFLGATLWGGSLTGRTGLKAQANIIEVVKDPSPVPTPSWTLKEKITEGQNLLQHSQPLQFTEEAANKKIKIRGKIKTIVENKLKRQETAFAVLDLATGQIFERRYWLGAEDIKRANTLRRNYLENDENLPRFMPKDITENFSIVTNWWNNFNSDWLVKKDGDGPEENHRYLVVAVKFLLGNDNFVYPEEKTGERYSDLIYVPYSAEGLHQAELTVQGKEFLDASADNAFHTLRSLAVESKAFPGELVVDTLTPEFIKNLFLTEQSDPKMMLLADDGGKKVAERVLVRLGANEEKTFRYTFSKTGALGLGQIMPGTYASTVKAYPRAELSKDIDVGRVDIENAIMASALILDDHLATVFRKLNKKQRVLLDKKMEKNPDFLNEVRAAIYNGGPKKYLAATATISLRVNETILFVKKYQIIRALRLFN